MLKTRNRNWNIRDDQTIFETGAGGSGGAGGLASAARARV